MILDTEDRILFTPCCRNKVFAIWSSRVRIDIPKSFESLALFVVVFEDAIVMVKVEKSLAILQLVKSVCRESWIEIATRLNCNSISHSSLTSYCTDSFGIVSWGKIHQQLDAETCAPDRESFAFFLFADHVFDDIICILGPSVFNVDLASTTFIPQLVPGKRTPLIFGRILS